MGNEASPRGSIEDRKQIAGGLFFIDDTSVREPAVANQLDNFDSHGIEWTSRVRKRAATGVALLTLRGRTVPRTSLGHVVRTDGGDHAQLRE
jgi:hypothetical protein